MRTENENLDGLLRQAVEQVRGQNPPREVLDSCLRLAKAVNPLPVPTSRKLHMFRAAMLAALVMLTLGLWAAGMASRDRRVADHGEIASRDERTDSGRDPLEPIFNFELESKGVPSKVELEYRLKELSSVIRDQKTVRGERRHVMRITQGGPSEFHEFPSAKSSVRPHQNLLIPKPGNKVDEEGEETHTTDQFKHFVSNPFQLVRQDPLSTFSSDVDTASYSLVRKFLKEENRLPPPDAVRIEEMINYFTYGYPQPTGEHPVSITPEVSACPWNKDHRLVRVAVQARSINNDDAPARNLVFLVDVSGSMNSENRLPLVKKSLHLLIDQLRAKDKVSIVVYAGSSGLYMDSTPGDQKDKIRDAVDRLGAGGSTNGAAGITEAYKQAHEHFIQGGTNRVILATDGDFNVGVTSEGDLVRMIEEKRNKGVYLTCLGYGMGNLKDSTIMKLANHGHGHYAYIDSLAEAKKVFVDEGMSLTTLAQDVKLQVEFNPKAVEAYRLIGYEKRIMRHEDFNDDSKHAAVLGCGHRVTVLYEIVPAGKQADLPAADPLKYQVESKLTDAAGSGELLTVKLRYKEPQGQKSKLMEAAIKDNGAGFDKASADFRWAAAVAAFGRILRDNPKDHGINLAGVRELAESAVGPDLKGYREEFIELVKMAEKLSRQ